MREAQLIAALEACARAELEKEPLNDALAALARIVCSAGGARRARIHCAFIPFGKREPGLDERVYTGDSDVDAPAGTERLGDLQVAAEAADRGDLRPLTFRVRPAGAFGPDPCLAVRIQTGFAILWAALALEEPIGADRAESWARAMELIVRSTLRPSHPLCYVSSDRIRNDFCAELLEIELARTDGELRGIQTELRRLCSLWQASTNADWAWLWLYNANNDEYELTSFAARDDGQPGAVPPLAERSVPSGEFNLGQYCSQRRRPEYVENVATWQRSLDGKLFRVRLASHLERLGCKAIDCVPLIDAPTSAGLRRTFSVVTLHYLRPSARVRLDEDALLHMGRATALFVRTAQDEEHKRVFERLSQLSQPYFGDIDSRPMALMAQYLDQVRDLIKTSMRVGCVSIFLRDRFENRIRCVSSTGLANAAGQRIAPDQYASVSYAPGEGWTGRCYAQGRIQLVSHPRAEPHVARYSEIRSATGKDGVDPVLLVPIPLAGAGRGADRRATGVIRCTEHTSELFQDRVCNFSPSEVATLAFIAQQISPVVQVLQYRVAREQSVSIVKHDLAAPIAMIRDTIYSVQSAVARGEIPASEDVLDVAVSTSLAANLVHQLGPDLTTVVIATRRSTLLEGDIIARLKAMMSHYAWQIRKMRIRFGTTFRQIPPLLIDSDLIERAFLNLIVNAIKYGEPGTTIEIDARPPESDSDYFVVTIANEGLGIQEHERERVFVPYYRSEEARRYAGQGVGLGLCIARRALELHEGQLRLTRLRSPTTFSLYFPKTAATR